ncbi:C39 family peptidase [Kribbella deserti]|uniref:C39 family peptidase n=1 Tax=Kribbella deserti TaxID=1926257 RepID=A0ABV6QJJ4_9ACTN
MATAARGAALILISAFLTPLTGPIGSAHATQTAPPPIERPAYSWSQLVQQVVETAPSASAAAEAGPAERAQQMMRCFKLQDENYCLGLGFVDEVPSDDEIAAAAAEPVTPADETFGGRTGALSTADFVHERAALNEEDRLDSELAEMRTAWQGREKAKALRTDQVEVARELPKKLALMGGYGTSQERGYWCGPATFQSIDWANDNQKDSQASWAEDLGTTTAGTGIGAMVQQTNLKTTWDNYAGTYIVQSVGHWDTKKFFDVHRKHLGDGTGAPVIEHTQLLKRYFPYLAYNYSGHYQVGRGYDTDQGTITIFEVFNEKRFNSRGNDTAGSQEIPASALFNATLANQFKNIGL